MGNQVRAGCQCGYDEIFVIGGSRGTYRTHSYFPYRCRECGIVEANVAVKPPVCPNASDHELARISNSLMDRIFHPVAYLKGVKPRWQAMLMLLGLLKPEVAGQWGDHEIFYEPYHCPKCGKMTLRFKPTGLLFD